MRDGHPGVLCWHQVVLCGDGVAFRPEKTDVIQWFAYFGASVGNYVPLLAGRRIEKVASTRTDELHERTTFLFCKIAGYRIKRTWCARVHGPPLIESHPASSIQMLTATIVDGNRGQITPKLVTKPPADAKKPKVFVSYSWTNQEHVERILAWCQRLVSDGIDVEIDRWSLSEGHDKFAFMEKMVTDPAITHVLIFSDAQYAQKADARAKGVGTESQIISAELYGRTTQDKFLPIVCEFTTEGEPCVPVFLKGRIYFNFSTPEAANDNWEKLVRRIYNKPALTKPRLGAAPTYLEAGSAPASLTASKFLVLRDAFQKGRPNVRLWVNDYLDAVAHQLEEYRITTPAKDAGAAAEKMRSTLESMLPLRDEIVEFFSLAVSSLPVAVRWTPKVGQAGSLTQTQKNDPYVQEASSAQS